MVVGREQYQIFNTEYGDNKVKTEWGAEIDERLSDRSQQYNGATIISIDRENNRQVIHNDISKFENITTTNMPENYSLFLYKGDRVEYKGNYDYMTIKRAIYDIKDLKHMEENGCIFSEERLEGYNRTRKQLGMEPEIKSDKEVEEMLQVREEVLNMCDPLLDEAQQAVNTVLDKIKTERSVKTKVRKVFGRLFGSKSLGELKQESQKLKAQENSLREEYNQSTEERDGKNGKE